MAKDPNTNRASVPEPELVQRAIAALMAADRDERFSGSETKSVETVLSQIGFSAKEVQSLTGGNYETIKTRIRRAK